jgi:hypothetical protein
VVAALDKPASRRCAPQAHQGAIMVNFPFPIAEDQCRPPKSVMDKHTVGRSR